jgi:hypothetical protein
MSYAHFQLGHVDFYPNVGQHPQPGCEGEGLDLDCSHQRAPVSYFSVLMTSLKGVTECF